MDTLLEIPELSTYAHVYNMTGGIVEINPMFTKRFNYDTDTRNYTFLAPTNAVSSSPPLSSLSSLSHAINLTQCHGTHRHGPRSPQRSTTSS